MRSYDQALDFELFPSVANHLGGDNTGFSLAIANTLQNTIGTKMESIEAGNWILGTDVWNIDTTSSTCVLEFVIILVVRDSKGTHRGRLASECEKWDPQVGGETEVRFFVCRMCT